ncbi:MAG TPA: hypothetical protein VFG32_01785 [Bacteroidota bacterium]|nr:hypothetical protein [Bacteroidota bacterium]
MENRVDRLNLFFERIKLLTFWQRVFAWRSLKNLSYEAYEEFKSLVGEADRISKELDQQSNAIANLKKDKEHLTSNIDTRDKTINEQGKEIALLKQKVDQLGRDISRIEQENVAFKRDESHRQREHENRMAVLKGEIERVGNERNREKDERQNAEIERLQSLKETWANHQDNVVGNIKRICQKHTIEYVENVPFKGKPDTVIKICDEHVVFDAKSPASDNLENFPTYIRTQTESVGKYVKEENVRKDLFLVVPSNTVDVLDQFCYNMADYSVYIVTVDALEPIILSLKKIEDYEFVNQMSPEERENICRVIGKFAHMTKRRIQIDHFFAWEFLDILTKCKADLPREILEKVVEFEKSEKLNPPQERRSKQILTRDLEDDAGRIQKEAEAKAIVFPPSLHRDIGQLPLYEDDESGHR